MSRTRDGAIVFAAIGAILALPGAVVAQHQDHAVVAQDSVLGGATITLRVDGMSCPFCAYGLEKRLTEMPAVDTLVVRVSKGLVHIRTKDGHELDDAILNEAVERAGFSLREIHRVKGL